MRTALLSIAKPPAQDFGSAIAPDGPLAKLLSKALHQTLTGVLLCSDSDREA